jgi:hypothetical protein
VSLTYTLRRWVDPDFESASEQAQQQRELEHDPEVVPGDLEDLKIYNLIQRPKVRECRVCHWRGEGGRFCMKCLAETLD